MPATTPPATRLSPDRTPITSGSPRMEDVAREAGVSLVTVSRAVNHPDKLAPRTLAVVQAAIDRLRYVPNLTAGSLASSRTRIAAAIIPTLASSIFSDTIDGLSQALADGGYQLLVGQTQFRAEDEIRLIDAFIGRRVDGVVLIRTSHGDEVGARFAHAGIPVVEAWELSDHPIDRVVGFSNRDAGEAAALYLADKGYGRLAFIGSEEGRSADRFDGFCAGALARGLAQPVMQPLPAPGTLAEAAAGFRALIAREPAVRAVLCSNDMLAAGVLFECQRAGLAVPSRVAVMGFADLPIAAAVEPRLTTVHVPSHQIGRRSGELLLARIRGDVGLPLRIDLGYRIIERASA